MSYFAPMTCRETADEVLPPGSRRERKSVRMAVLELLANAAPRPAALATPSAEEKEFLDTLRRIVARSAAEDLLDRYAGSRSDDRAWIFARFED